MGIFNKYFGNRNQEQMFFLTPVQVKKFIRDNSILFDDNLNYKYEHGYGDSFDENFLEQEEFKEFKINMLILTIFGIAHNDHFKVNEAHLVNMFSKEHRQSLYTQSALALCASRENNRHALNGVIKNTQIKGTDDRKIVTRRFWNDMTFRLDQYLRPALDAYGLKDRKELDIKDFEDAYYMYLNHNANSTFFEDESAFEEHEVHHFAVLVHEVYNRALLFLKNDPN